MFLGLDRKDGDLANFVEQVSTPGSPSYGQYLSMEEIAERFGASTEAVQAVFGYLETWGMNEIELGSLKVDAVSEYLKAHPPGS